MKKLLSVVLALSMMISAAAFFCSTVSAENITHGYVLGDADDDGNLSMKDVILIRRYLNILADEKNISLLAADADINENVDMKDVILIRKFLLSLEENGGNNTDEMYRIDRLLIDGRNIGRYTVVIPENYNACMENSAKELSRYINNAVGISLNITDKEEDVPSYMIKYVYDTDDNYDLGKEGYRVELDDAGNVIFTCGSARGCLYVTYFFLEEVVGYRFLTNDVTYIYEAETVNMPSDFEETEVPEFSYRVVSAYGFNTVTYNNFPMLRQNAVDGVASRACAYERWGGGVGTIGAHAHSFVDQCGVPNDKQPCLTSEETYNQVVDYNLKLLKGKKYGINYTQISCSPNDNTQFCECTNCKNIYAEEGSIAGTVFRLSNRVAERIAQDYPETEIFTIAYWDARNPPKYTRPHDNVCVCFCISGCNNHSYYDIESCLECGGNKRLQNGTWSGETLTSSNAIDIEYYLKWTELTNNVYVWYYADSFAYYMAPSPNIFNAYYDFKFIAETGAEGIYAEAEGYQCFEALHDYLMAKMQWNPYMSEEEFNDLLNEFLVIYYGDGWEYVREYIEMTNYAGDINGCWTNNFDRPFNMYNEEYFRDNYHRMSELFDKAIEGAQTEVQKDRLEHCRLHCDWLGLSATYDRDYVNGDDETRSRFIDTYKRLYNTLVSEDIQVTSFGGGSLGCRNLPDSADEIVKPVSWLWDGANGYW